MANFFVCPIDGTIGLDNGTNTVALNQNGATAVPAMDAQAQPTAYPAQTAITVNTTTAVGDPWGNAAHCPICGCALVTFAAATVTTVTGVAAGAGQTAPVIDVCYGATTDSPLSQNSATSNAAYSAQANAAGYQARYAHNHAPNPMAGVWSGVNAQDSEPTTWTAGGTHLNRGDQDYQGKVETVNSIGP